MFRCTILTSFQNLHIFKRRSKSLCLSYYLPTDWYWCGFSSFWQSHSMIICWYCYEVSRFYPWYWEIRCFLRVVLWIGILTNIVSTYFYCFPFGSNSFSSTHYPNAVSILFLECLLASVDVSLLCCSMIRCVIIASLGSIIWFLSCSGILYRFSSFSFHYHQYVS